MIRPGISTPGGASNRVSRTKSVVPVAKKTASGAIRGVALDFGRSFTVVKTIGSARPLRTVETTEPRGVGPRGARSSRGGEMRCDPAGRQRCRIDGGLVDRAGEERAVGSA